MDLASRQDFWAVIMLGTVIGMLGLMLLIGSTDFIHTVYSAAKKINRSKKL